MKVFRPLFLDFGKRLMDHLSSPLPFIFLFFLFFFFFPPRWPNRYGHYDQCISRPELYNILLSRIPKNRLHLGKRFVNFQHINLSNPHLSSSNSSTFSGSSYSLGGSEFEKIKARCSDGTFYHADILVGADGASSAVRQSLYRQLKEEGTLPKSDQEDQQYKQVALVGVTNALNPKKYPDLNKEFSHYKAVLNRNSPYIVSEHFVFFLYFYFFFTCTMKRIMRSKLTNICVFFFFVFL